MTGFSSFHEALSFRCLFLHSPRKRCSLPLQSILCLSHTFQLSFEAGISENPTSVSVVKILIFPILRTLSRNPENIIMHNIGWDILTKRLIERKREKHLPGQALKNIYCYCQCFSQMILFSFSNHVRFCCVRIYSHLSSCYWYPNI